MAEESKSDDVETSDMVPDIDFEKILEKKNPSGYRLLQTVAKSLLLPAKGKATKVVKELQKVLDFRLRVYGPRNDDERLVRNGIAKIINEGGLNDEFIQDLDRIGVSGGGALLQRTKDFYEPFSKDRSPANMRYLEKQVLGYARQQYLLMLLENSITRDEAGNPVHDRVEYYKREYEEKYPNLGPAPDTYIQAMEDLMEQMDRADVNYQEYEECQENLEDANDQIEEANKKSQQCDEKLDKANKTIDKQNKQLRDALDATRQATQRANSNEQLAHQLTERVVEAHNATRQATQRSNYNEQLAAAANQQLNRHFAQQARRRQEILHGRATLELDARSAAMADQVDIPTADAVAEEDFFPVSSARRIAGAAGVAAAAVAARQLRKSRKRCEYVPKPNSPPNVNENDREFNEIVRNDVIELFKETPQMFKDIETIVKETRQGDVYTYVLEMFSKGDPPFMNRLLNEMSAAPLQSQTAFNNLSDYRSLLEHRIFPAFLEGDPDEPIFQNGYGLPDILNEIISIVKNCAGGKQFTNNQQRMIQNLHHRYTLNPSQSFNYGMGKRRRKSRSRQRRRSKSRRRSRSRRRRRSKPRRRSKSRRRRSRSKSRRRRSVRKCWPGYKRVPGKSPYSKGSCVKR